MRRIQVGLSDETLTRVDEARGITARETWLRAQIEKALDRTEEVKAADRFAATKGGGTSSKPVTELKQPPPGPAPGARPRTHTHEEEPATEHRRHHPVRDGQGRWVCKDGGEPLQMGPSGL